MDYGFALQETLEDIFSLVPMHFLGVHPLKEDGLCVHVVGKGDSQ